MLLNVKTVDLSHLKVNAVIAKYISSFSNLLVITSAPKHDARPPNNKVTFKDVI